MYRTVAACQHSSKCMWVTWW